MLRDLKRLPSAHQRIRWNILLDLLQSPGDSYQRYPFRTLEKSARKRADHYALPGRSRSLRAV